MPVHLSLGKAGSHGDATVIVASRRVLWLSQIMMRSLLDQFYSGHRSIESYQLRPVNHHKA